MYFEKSRNVSVRIQVRISGALALLCVHDFGYSNRPLGVKSFSLVVQLYRAHSVKCETTGQIKNKAIMAYADICLERLKKSMKKFSQERSYPAAIRTG
jgi:hypothetical protein